MERDEWAAFAHQPLPVSAQPVRMRGQQRDRPSLLTSRVWLCAPAPFPRPILPSRDCFAGHSADASEFGCDFLMRGLVPTPRGCPQLQAALAGPRVVRATCRQQPLSQGRGARGALVVRPRPRANASPPVSTGRAGVGRRLQQDNGRNAAGACSQRPAFAFRKHTACSTMFLCLEERRGSAARARAEAAVASLPGPCVHVHLGMHIQAIGAATCAQRHTAKHARS